MRKILRKISLLIVPLLISACGGGSDGASVSDPNADADNSPTLGQIVQGQLVDDVVVVLEDELQAITLDIDSYQDEMLNITDLGSTLSELQTGDVVVLPASETQGIPLGLTAKAVKNSDGSLSLEPAELKDVFTNRTYANYK
ncbi:MAG: hypothetical protein KIG95_01150, partial [Comamonas sp.]|nr:hypothetical protein [Comamonas sp.]